MEEQEWQPVIIAPVSKVACAHQVDSDELEEYRKDVGKKVYVLIDPDDDYRDPDCGGRMYLIRPSDEAKLNGWEDHHWLCEHEIITD
jgi:hypothetical protein